MAICNLFKKLSNNTGEFLLFSQYTEDLTKNNAQGYKYRVVPSRFIAADIDFKNFKYGKEDLNIDFPTYLQNYFENGCALCKNNPNIQWTPEVSANLFWNSMLQSGLINIVDSDTNDINKYVKEFRCIEEINIQSYDVMDGMGYSEIYCYIPNTAKSTLYSCSVKELTSYISPTNGIVEGYKEEDYKEGMLDWNILDDYKYFYEKNISFQFETESNYNYTVLNDEKFNINCIIVLYDIYSIDESGEIKTLYKNIPMGVYLPGSFDGDIVKNVITKWVNNSDIYDSGTSYGIRICSRFSATSNYDSIKTTEVRSIDSDEYSSLCQVMGGISDNLDKMMSVVKDSVFESTNLKETFAIFKNSRTNVPYPIELYGQKYWYVNGRNTGIKIPDGTTYSAYDNQDISNALMKWDGVEATLVLKVYVINKEGEPIYIERLSSNDIQSPVDLLVRWDLFDKYTQETVSIDGLNLEYPDGTIVELDPKTQIFTIHDVTTDGMYNLIATWSTNIDGVIDDHTITANLDFKFCYPVFFGLVSDISAMGEDNTGEMIVNIINGTIDINSKLKKYILPTHYNRIQFESNVGRILYAYPKEYGTIEKVLNLNSMDDCIHDFIESEVKVKLNDNTQVDYYLYHTKNSTGDGILVEFDFTNDNRRIDNTIIYK